MRTIGNKVKASVDNNEYNIRFELMYKSWGTAFTISKPPYTTFNVGIGYVYRFGVIEFCFTPLVLRFFTPYPHGKVKQ